MIKKRDEDRGYITAISASGWQGGDYREIEDLERSELNEIYEISTDEDVVARLKVIEQAKHQNDIVTKFCRKALPADDAFLRDLKVKVNKTYDEKKDVSIEDRFIDKMNIELPKGKNSKGKRSKTGIVITRETNQLETKITTIHEKTKRVTSNGTTKSISTKNLYAPRHQTSRGRAAKRQRLISTDPPGHVMQDNGTLSSTMEHINCYSCFDNKDFVLAKVPINLQHLAGKYQNVISVADELTSVLKDHQKKGKSKRYSFYV